MGQKTEIPEIRQCTSKCKNKEIANGGMQALEISEVPFNEYYFFDKGEINITAFKKRAGDKINCHFKVGDSNLEVRTLVKNF